MSTSENAVRAYLRWLEDPASVLDHQAIAAAKQEAETAEDPLDRLKALSRLQELESVDGEGFRAAFVAQAAAWASENGVTAEAFVTYGVPAEVLSDAGIIHAKPTAPRGSNTRGGKRRGRVSPEEVRAAIPPGEFTIADLERASGASTATVRKVIAEMTESGELRDLGPDQSHSGRGRAPLKFTRS
jgi:hypothetical protein